MVKVLKVIGINLGLLLAVLLGAELIFGGWIGTNYGTLVIPKDFSRRFDVKDLYGGNTITFKRDEHGLRGAYASPAEIDILTIGGSTTNEIFIDEGATWSDTIAKAFAEEGREITVVNAGVDGQTTIGHNKNFELWFPKIPGLQPRYILAYIGINDHALATSGHMAKQDHMEAPRRKLKQFLMNNSALYTLFRNIRGMIRARQANLVHVQQSYNGTNWTPAASQPDIGAAEREFADHLAAYAERLRTLAGNIRSLGAEPIFVTQHKGTYRIRDGAILGRPLEDGTVDTDAYAGLSAFNRVTLEVCAEVKGVCLDLAGELLFVDGDHYDGLHTTPVGSDKVGRFLQAKLKGVID